MKNNIEIIYRDRMNNLDKINMRLCHVIAMLKSYIEDASKGVQVDITINAKY